MIRIFNTYCYYVLVFRFCGLCMYSRYINTAMKSERLHAYIIILLMRLGVCIYFMMEYVIDEKKIYNNKKNNVCYFLGSWVGHRTRCVTLFGERVCDYYIFIILIIIIHFIIYILKTDDCT